MLNAIDYRFISNNSNEKSEIIDNLLEKITIAAKEGFYEYQTTQDDKINIHHVIYLKNIGFNIKVVHNTSLSYKTFIIEWDNLNRV